MSRINSRQPAMEPSLSRDGDEGTGGRRGCAHRSCNGAVPQQGRRPRRVLLVAEVRRVAMEPSLSRDGDPEGSESHRVSRCAAMEPSLSRDGDPPVVSYTNGRITLLMEPSLSRDGDPPCSPRTLRRSRPVMEPSLSRDGDPPRDIGRAIRMASAINGAVPQQGRRPPPAAERRVRLSCDLMEPSLSRDGDPPSFGTGGRNMFISSEWSRPSAGTETPRHFRLRLTPPITTRMEPSLSRDGDPRRGG